MDKNDTITVSCVFKCDAGDVLNMEEALRSACEVVSFNHLPDTTGLYATDKEYKKIVDNERKWKDAKRDYYNKNNIE